MLAVLFVYELAVVLTFSVATTVFNTALFAYAETGHAAPGFDRSLLAGAIGRR